MTGVYVHGEVVRDDGHYIQVSQMRMEGEEERRRMFVWHALHLKF
jgi:hypothetical protein